MPSDSSARSASRSVACAMRPRHSSSSRTCRSVVTSVPFVLRWYDEPLGCRGKCWSKTASSPPRPDNRITRVGSPRSPGRTSQEVPAGRGVHGASALGEVARDLVALLDGAVAAVLQLGLDRLDRESETADAGQLASV